MTALVAATTTGTFADVHREPPSDRPRLGQLILVLVLDPLLLDLPATLTPRRQRRVELLVDLLRRLAMTMPAVPLSRPAARTDRSRLRRPARERRRLTLGSPPRLLKLALQLPDPGPQPLVLAREPHELVPQLVVLSRQRRAPRLQLLTLVYRPRRQLLNP